MSVLDKLKAATRARRSYSLCLDAGLQAEYDLLTAGLDAAVAADSLGGSLADGSPNLKAHVEKMEAVRDRMAESMVTFTVEQIEWTERVALQAAHPPRVDNVMDQMRGYNLETFLPALVKASTVSVEDASGDVAIEIPDDVWDSLFAALNFAGMDRLADVALQVNDQDTRVPTSARSLIESPDSGASLAQPSPGTSAPDASEAGSRPTSRRTNTTKRATGAKRATSSGSSDAA